MRRIVLFLSMLTALPGCCVLEMHSPVSPLAFVKASNTASSTPNKSIRPSAADNSPASAAELAN